MRIVNNKLGVLSCLVLFIINLSHANAVELREVSRVIDGDTLVLQGGERVRLLGINAPEMKRHGGAAEQGGLRAKKYLQQLLSRQLVYLEYDLERTDHYGRSLAYVFLDNGLHLNAELLKNGMVTLSIHPPNVKYLGLLLAAQENAERLTLGVWAEGSHAPKYITAKAAGKLKGRWARFKGRVKGIEYTSKGAKLYLSTRCYVWISESHYRYFPKLSHYLNRELEARTWLKKWGHEWSMRVSHPSQLILKPK